MQSRRRLSRAFVKMRAAAVGKIVLLVAAPVFDVAMQLAAVRPHHNLRGRPGSLDELEAPVAMRTEPVRVLRQPFQADIRAARAGFAIGLRLQQRRGDRFERFRLCGLRRRSDDRDKQRSDPHMLRRYCPPTSNSACVICPSEQTRTASIRTANTFSSRITAWRSR